MYRSEAIARISEMRKLTIDKTINLLELGKSPAYIAEYLLSREREVAEFTESLSPESFRVVNPKQVDEIIDRLDKVADTLEYGGTTVPLDEVDNITKTLRETWSAVNAELIKQTNRAAAAEQDLYACRSRLDTANRLKSEAEHLLADYAMKAL